MILSTCRTLISFFFSLNRLQVRVFKQRDRDRERAQVRAGGKAKTPNG